MRQLLNILVLIVILSCSAQEKENDIVLEEEVINYSFEPVVVGLDIPWGMDFLPDGSLLVTDKGGNLFHIVNGLKTKISNVPEIYQRGQGGLLDIALHPNYADNGWIYLSLSSENNESGGGNTQLVRAKLTGGGLTQVEVLYAAKPNTTSGIHFGSRIVFDNLGYVYFTIGDRGNHDENPQDITRDGGKVYRLHDNGAIPKDNPYIGKEGAKEAIFSYGHRNQQGMVKHLVTGEIWVHEHGPQGGDEINILKKGANYGWPVITYGINYNGTIITEETHRPGMEQPIYYWTPSIAPSGMCFVSSNLYPNWKGHLLVGSLKFQYLELVKLRGNEVIGRQKIATDIGRLRNVKQGPDGYIYIAVEGKGIFKIIPNN